MYFWLQAEALPRFEDLSRLLLSQNLTEFRQTLFGHPPDHLSHYKIDIVSPVLFEFFGNHSLSRKNPQDNIKVSSSFVGAATRRQRWEAKSRPSQESFWHQEEVINLCRGQTDSLVPQGPAQLTQENPSGNWGPDRREGQKMESGNLNH